MAGWWRERRAEGVVRMLARAADPAAKLDLLGSAVDDTVISALLDESARADQTGRGDDALRWADLALRATLLGGGARARAEALLWHAGTVLDRLDPADDTLGQRELIDLAEAEGDAAAAVYAETGPVEDHLMALLLLARVAQARDETRSVIRRLLDCARRVSDTTDRELAIGVLDRLAQRYFALREADADVCAVELITELGPVEACTADHRAKARLANLLGDAHRRLQHDADVRAMWSTATDLYHNLGEVHEEFRVRTELLDYAAPRDDLDLALEAGLACLAAAPPDTSPASLAAVHHLVGFVHHRRGEVDEAARAFAREVDVGAADPNLPAGPVLFEAAMMMIDSGRFTEARTLLDDLLTREGFEHLFWAAHYELAIVLGQHLGDVGAGIEHAESALAQAVSMETKRPIMRVLSLHLSAALHMLAGDVDTAYRRSRLLTRLLVEPLEIHLMSVSRTYDYAVVPRQSRADMLRLAADMSRAAGRAAEATALLDRARDATDDPPPMMPMDDFADDEIDDEMISLEKARTDLGETIALLESDPRAALARLENFPAVIVDSPTAAFLRLIAGRAHLQLGDRPAARAEFERCLADGGAQQSELAQQCHRYLAEICLAERRYEQAHGHLTARVRALESARASLRDVEARIRFLRMRLAIYHQLIDVSLALGWRAEAFAFVQRIKSRSLLDLMAEGEHRPIDRTLDTRAARVRDDRETWIETYFEGTLLDGESDDVTTWPRIRMHTDYLAQRDALAAIARERAESGLFDRLRGEGAPVDYDAVRTMLT